jgi:hypothetical protein
METNGRSGVRPGRLLDAAARTLSLMGLVITVALMVAWDRRRRGTYASGRPPREFNETILRLMMGSRHRGHRLLRGHRAL